MIYTMHNKVLLWNLFNCLILGLCSYVSTDKQMKQVPRNYSRAIFSNVQSEHIMQIRHEREETQTQERNGNFFRNLDYSMSGKVVIHQHRNVDVGTGLGKHKHKKRKHFDRQSSHESPHISLKDIHHDSDDMLRHSSRGNFTTPKDQLGGRKYIFRRAIELDEHNLAGSLWDGMYFCKGNTKFFQFLLNISKIDAGSTLIGLLHIDNRALIVSVRPFNQLVVIQGMQMVTEKIFGKNFTNFELNMNYIPDDKMEGALVLKDNGNRTVCTSELHRTTAITVSVSKVSQITSQLTNQPAAISTLGPRSLRCSQYLSLLNGNVTIDGELAIFRCSDGYHLLGDPTAECINGSWNSWVPICSICQPLFPLNHTKIVFRLSNDHGIHVAAEVFCTNSSGYAIREEYSCTNEGLWNTNSKPQCEFFFPASITTISPVRPFSVCVPSSVFENGNITLNGNSVRFQCNPGYNLLGPSVVQCFNGQLNDTAPICSRCQPIPVPKNGNIDYSVPGGTLIMASVSCSDGYVIRGDTMIYCMNNDWIISETPACMRNVPTCKPLNNIANGAVKVSDFSNGSIALYICDEGYDIAGAAIRRCLNGSWTDEEPFCRIADCGPPGDVVNGKVETIGGTTFRSIAVYICDPGYLIVGNKSRICQGNGSWSEKVPVCHPVDCGNLTDPVNGTVHYMSRESRTGYGAFANYTCLPGSTLVGYVQRLCQSSGRWSGSSPRCILSQPNTRNCERHIDSWGTTWNEALPGQIVVLPCNGPETTGDISRRCSMLGVWYIPEYNCIRRSIANIQQQVEELHSSPTSAGVSHTLDQLADLTTAEISGELHSGELESITNSLDMVADISDSQLLITDEQSRSFLRTASNILDQRNVKSWQALSQTEDTQGGSRVLSSIDKFSTAVFRTFEHGNATKVSVAQDNIVMVVEKVSTNQEEISFPEQTNRPDWLGGSKTGFDLPLQQNNKVKSYSGVIYRNLTSILPDRAVLASNESHNDTHKILNTPVLSLQLYPPQSNLSDTLHLTFQHQKANFRNATCGFWSFASNQWETEGCRVKSSENDITVCECDHLTNFAVLMSPWNTENAASTVIEIISIVGCSVSIICLIITAIAHLFLWRYVKSDRVVILINICIALTVSYIIFLAGVNQTQNKDVCTAVAGLLQYIYLVVFFLMLAEGIEIAVTVLYVFSTKSRIKWLLPAAWGIPAVIVGISMGITKLEGYGTKDFCWLSVDNGLIWAFVGPAVFIILVNIIFLVLVLRAMLSSRAVSEKTDTEKIKCSLRCLCVLLPLMGCTWVLGIFYVNERMVWVQYVFSVCNSLQGFFIFLFHGFLNKQLRVAIKRRHKKYRDSATTSKILSSKPKELKRDKPLLKKASEYDQEMPQPQTIHEEETHNTDSKNTNEIK